MQQGIHDIPDGLYHSDPCEAPSLSNSIIKTLLGQSPAHARIKHPRLTVQVPREDNERFDRGTAAHDMLLRGEDSVWVIHADDWRTKAAKEQRDEARAAGRIPMLERHHEETCKMVEVARDYIARSTLGNVLQDGAAERTIIWEDAINPIDPLDRIWCRGKLDWLTTDKSLILDYKSTSMGSPGAFCRSSMVAFGYDTQEVFYRRGMAAITGVTPDFYFVVQEDTAPYACYLVQPAPSMRAVAESKVERAIKLWHQCLSTDTWPGYPEFVYHAEALPWHVTEEEAHHE